MVAQHEKEAAGKADATRCVWWKMTTHSGSGLLTLGRTETARRWTLAHPQGR